MNPISAHYNNTHNSAAAAAVAGSLAPKSNIKQTLPNTVKTTPIQKPATSTATAATSGSSSTSSSSSSSASSGSSTITSNDFLTLLVSELKNQDPTQPTDPNAYITQLVGVNSLQQLISINQGIGALGTATTPPATPPASGSSTPAPKV